MRGLTLTTLALLGATTVQAKSYDVCVIGAGASGVASSVYATKNGYSVLLIDSQRDIGGHCDTYIRPENTRVEGTPYWLDTGVGQLADTQAINHKLGALPNGKPRWTVDTKKYVDAFVPPTTDPFTNYLIPLNIPADPFYSVAAQWQVDPSHGYVNGPIFGSSLLPNFSDPRTVSAFQDLQNLTTNVYPWLDNGELDGPIPDPDLLLPFSEFIVKRGWDTPSLMTLFSSVLWYAVAMDKFDTLPTYYALRFLSPTPALLFNDANYWYTFNGGCQVLYDRIHDQLLSRPYNKILVNTTITSIKRPDPNSWWSVFDDDIILHGYTLGVDAHGTSTNTSFTHKCNSLIFGMPAEVSNLQNMGFTLDPNEYDIFHTVKAHGYYGGAVDSEGGIVNQTLSDPLSPPPTPFYNVLHVNVADPPYYLSAGDPTWISLQGVYGIGSISLFAGFASTYISQKPAQTIMQNQLNADLTQPIGDQPAVLNQARIVDFHAHRYQARPAISELTRPSGWYSAIRSLQGYRSTYWTGATVNFPLHHVCMNEAYKLILQHFPNQCGGWLSYFGCLITGRLVDWDL